MSWWSNRSHKVQKWAYNTYLAREIWQVEACISITSAWCQRCLGNRSYFIGTSHYTSYNLYWLTEIHNARRHLLSWLDYREVRKTGFDSPNLILVWAYCGKCATESIKRERCKRRGWGVIMVRIDNPGDWFREPREGSKGGRQKRRRKGLIGSGLYIK